MISNPPPLPPWVSMQSNKNLFYVSPTCKEDIEDLSTMRIDKSYDSTAFQVVTVYKSHKET